MPEIEPSLSIPILHIAEATALEIKRLGLKKVALMGVMKTMESDFYPRALARHGIDCLIPEMAERQIIDDIISDELVQDLFTAESRKVYTDLIADFIARGAEGTILGCTEIPLLIGQGDVETPVLSTSELHCRATVDRMLG